MPKQGKNTRYLYRKSPFNHVHDQMLKNHGQTDFGVETEDQWIDRLKIYGITDEQIAAFIEVRSLDAFLACCREHGVELADINKSRLDSN